jgi:hypothetical protein
VCHQEELLTISFNHIKAKTHRGDMPLDDLHYCSGRIFLKVGSVSEFFTLWVKM